MKPLHHIIVMYKNNIITRHFCWLLPKNARVRTISKKGNVVTTQMIKIGRGYQLQHKTAELANGALDKILEIRTFKTDSAMAKFCRGQGKC